MVFGNWSQPLERQKTVLCCKTFFLHVLCVSCACIYVCLHAVQTCVLVYMHICRGLRLTLEFSLNTLHYIHWGRVCQLNPEFVVLTNLSCLCLPSASITGQLPHTLCMYMESGDLHLGSYSCLACTLSTEPLPWVLDEIVCRCNLFSWTWSCSRCLLCQKVSSWSKCACVYGRRWEFWSCALAVPYSRWKEYLLQVSQRSLHKLRKLMELSLWASLEDIWQLWASAGPWWRQRLQEYTEKYAVELPCCSTTSISFLFSSNSPT